MSSARSSWARFQAGATRDGIQGPAATDGNFLQPWGVFPATVQSVSEALHLPYRRSLEALHHRHAKHVQLKTYIALDTIHSGASLDYFYEHTTSSLALLTCSHACPSPWCTPLLLASTARRNHRCSAASHRESQHRRRRWRHRRGGQRWCPQGLRHHSCHAGRHRRQLGHLGDQPWWCGRQVKRAIRQGTRCEASGQLRSEPLRAKARQWAH
jgi:hypothetical protein